MFLHFVLRAVLSDVCNEREIEMITLVSSREPLLPFESPPPLNPNFSFGFPPPRFIYLLSRPLAAPIFIPVLLLSFLSEITEISSNPRHFFPFLRAYPRHINNAITRASKARASEKISTDVTSPRREIARNHFLPFHLAPIISDQRAFQTFPRRGLYSVTMNSPSGLDSPNERVHCNSPFFLT